MIKVLIALAFVAVVQASIVKRGKSVYTIKILMYAYSTAHSVSE